MQVQFVIEQAHTGIHGGLHISGLPTAYLMTNLIVDDDSMVICDYTEDRLRYGVIYGTPGKKNYYNATQTVPCSPEYAVTLVEEFLNITKVYCPPISLDTWINADIQHQNWIAITDSGEFAKPLLLAESKVYNVKTLVNDRSYFRETTEDFCPTISDRFVKVTCAQTGVDEEWRVGVWGGKDYGLVKTFDNKIEALLCQAAVAELEEVTHDALYALGFEVYGYS